MGDRPLIGVTPAYNADKDKLQISRGYIDGINTAGGLAVLMPLAFDDGIICGLLQTCDGVLLSGGADIDAYLYGEANLKANGEISPHRDKMELAVARKAIELKKPVFGICRGIQILNVALGGTLYQDINSQIRGRELLKHWQEAPDWYPVHEVKVNRGSFVWDCYGSENIRVNSFHHQAVKEPGDGLEITAVSPDGVVEAVEYKGGAFAVGVQWHPELMWREDKGCMKLFQEFVKEAKK
jgi:putative glutamine amidotransferase